MHTLKYLRKFVRYDPKTGHFYWLVQTRMGSAFAPGAQVRGKIQITKGRVACLIIGIDGQMFRAHRLAWWFMTGKKPPKGLDVEHENRNPLINKWKNLRLATRSQNNMNASLYRNNKSGHKGIYLRKRVGEDKWSARITVDGKVILLGEFKTYDGAVSARRAAEKKHHGKFANSHKDMKT